MQETFWKVGDLADRTGVSIRSLHYYDEIGLLEPSHRTGSGHRLYGADDVVRLQQIKSLRQLGFSLEEVRKVLARPEYAPIDVIQMHIGRLGERIDVQQKLRTRLTAIHDRLASKDRVSVEEFMETIKEIGRIEQLEKYYTPEQTAYLTERRQTLGDDAVRQGEADWKTLIAEVKIEMNRGTDPTSGTVKELAKRWQALIQAFSGGDMGIEKSVARVWKHEPELRTQTGIDSDMFGFIGKALTALKVDE